MNSIVPANFGQVSSKFAGVPVEDDLGSGVQSSFGMIGYKGKVWSVRFRGDEQNLLRDDGDGPRNSIEIVILKAAAVISKVWYKDGYVEGSTAPPDCFSNSGIKPEEASTLKQSPTCAICPRNQWGSRITPAGKQGKDCSDSKRLAVLPLEDLQNEVYGGPMLLRVPAASLQDMAMYGSKMAQLGYPYMAIGTRISFDVNESYPKFIFNAIRPLNDDEADVILSYADNHTVDRILSESEFSTVAEPDASGAFEQPPEVPQTKAPAKQVTQGGTKPAAAAKPAANQTVGQQARAAAAATAEGQKPKPTTKPAAAAAKPAAGGFGATAPAAAKPAAGTVAATPAQQVAAKALAAVKKPESPAIAAAKAALAAAEAAAALAAAEAEAAEQQEADEAGEQEEVTLQGEETEGEDDGNVASEFEANLDEMLSGLLPPS